MRNFEYGSMRVRWVLLSVVAVAAVAFLLSVVPVGHAQEEKPERGLKEPYERKVPGALQAEEVFERLKSLEGSWLADWETRGVLEDEEAVPIEFQLASCGTVLLERTNPNPDKGEPDLFNAYHLDGPDLVVTHYCALGNQPKMRLDRSASKPNDLVFRFAGASNLDRTEGDHMRLDRIALLDSGEAVQEWSIWKGDQHVSSHRVVMKRAERSAEAN